MNQHQLALIAGAGLALAGTHASAGPVDDSIGPVLFYRQPAREWVEALPVGNGRLGGMVFGGVPAERIQLNEDTFWSGGPYDPINPEALSYLPKVRQLIREGRYREAQDLADQKLMGRPRNLQAYQPLGDLRLVLEGHEAPTDYRREVDLDRAVVRVRYRVGDTTFTREVFSSAPDQAIVVRLTREGPARLRLAVTLDSKQPFTLRPLAPHGLLMSGRWRGDLTKPEDHLNLSENLHARWYGEGLAFAVQIAADAQGGRALVDEKGLRVVDADSVTLRLAAATSFRGRDPEAACVDALRTQRPYDELLARHVTDHRSLFRRVRLDLGSPDRDQLPTDERLAPVRAGTADPGLAALYFQYGRYLLISSSPARARCPRTCRASGTTTLSPAWDSKYTININTEMNYWPAEVDEPLRVPRAAVRPDRRGCARRADARRGACTGRAASSPTTTPTCGVTRRPSTAPAGASGRWAARGSASISGTTTTSRGDRAFLANRAYPS